MNSDSPYRFCGPGPFAPIEARVDPDRARLAEQYGEVRSLVAHLRELARPLDGLSLTREAAAEIAATVAELDDRVERLALDAYDVGFWAGAEDGWDDGYGEGVVDMLDDDPVGFPAPERVISLIDGAVVTMESAPGEAH